MAAKAMSFFFWMMLFFPFGLYGNKWLGYCCCLLRGKEREGQNEANVCIPNLRRPFFGLLCVFVSYNLPCLLAEMFIPSKIVAILFLHLFLLLPHPKGMRALPTVMPMHCTVFASLFPKNFKKREGGEPFIFPSRPKWFVHRRLLCQCVCL